MVLVDETCIGCGMCENYAPTIFKIDEESRLSTVIKQPENDEEHKQVEEAINACPVGSIKK